MSMDPSKSPNGGQKERPEANAISELKNIKGAITA